MLFSGFTISQESLSQKKEQEEIKQKKFFYNPAGRRDPFRDLLTGQTGEEKPRKGGREGLSVEEIILVGITKVRGEYTAVVNGPDGFPYFIKKGDKFYDGYVLSIDENKIILRKRLKRPVKGKMYRDIVKKLELGEED
jgi:Tfp pilus assembly protein PilP